jgi:CspA family cold shock protein
MAKGTVTSFDNRKGFGFIKPEDGGPEVYLHVSAVERSGLARVGVGDKLVYELQKDATQNRMNAVRLAFA